MGRVGVFIDRDGTLNEEVGYLDDVDRLRRFPYGLDRGLAIQRGNHRIALVFQHANQDPEELGLIVRDEYAGRIGNHTRIIAAAEQLDHSKGIWCRSASIHLPKSERKTKLRHAPPAT